ncbi:EndoU nuclease [Fibrobacter sp. UWCM]|uniref:EndoU domain-containing protein n=1 Tax=Fibrobacter sp. UWCM TaxID=1896208 RepID=UPI000922F235|nr:EndoU domain-containing protein [Fibrobacter sp. UWCM]SHH24232.1 EndoU nuclease [Fibrobacter sp. UWCM]
MGLKVSTQSVVFQKMPELPERHRHLLNRLPKHYHQTELFSEMAQVQNPEKLPKQYLKGDLETLEHTELFESNLIKHIFNGEVKTASAGKGKTRLEATGYHTEVIRNAEGRIIPGTKSELNEKGVYQGRVTVNGIRKRTMGGMSTFFPEHWSPQHIVNAINEAYANKRLKTNTLNMYEGSSSEGVRIRMRVNANGKIVNVYPLMEEN